MIYYSFYIIDNYNKFNSLFRQKLIDRLFKQTVDIETLKTQPADSTQKLSPSYFPLVRFPFISWSRKILRTRRVTRIILRSLCFTQF